MESLQQLGLLGLFIGTFLAATFIPFSSDALFVGILAATKDPLGCLVVGTLGNWLGGITSYLLGRLAKWEWVEKAFRIKPETLEKQKERIDKYGIWGLLLFVAIPLPGTGGWTGALLASLLHLDKKKSFGVICVGVFIAGLIITVLSLIVGAAVFG